MASGTFKDYIEKDFTSRQPTLPDDDSKLDPDHPMYRQLQEFMLALSQEGTTEGTLQQHLTAIARSLIVQTNKGKIQTAIGLDLNTLKVHDGKPYKLTNMYTIEQTVVGASKRPMETLPDTRPAAKKSKSANASPLRKQLGLLHPAVQSSSVPPAVRTPSPVSDANSDANSEATRSSRGGTRFPDVSLIVRLLGYLLVSLIGKMKIHSTNPGENTDINAKTKEAFCQAVMYLVAASEICGTWLGFVMVNSKFGRLAVVKDETNVGAPETMAPRPGPCNATPSDQSPLNPESKERIVTVAIELSIDVTTPLPSHIVDLPELLLHELHPLIPHDLSESTHPETGFPSQVEEDFCYSVPSVRRLWNMFRIGFNILFSQKVGTSLGRLPAPDEAFEDYVADLLSIAKKYKGTKKDLHEVVKIRRKIDKAHIARRTATSGSKGGGSGDGQGGSSSGHGTSNGGNGDQARPPPHDDSRPRSPLGEEKGQFYSDLDKQGGGRQHASSFEQNLASDSVTHHKTHSAPSPFASWTDSSTTLNLSNLSPNTTFPSEDSHSTLVGNIESWRDKTLRAHGAGVEEAAEMDIVEELDGEELDGEELDGEELDGEEEGFVINLPVGTKIKLLVVSVSEMDRLLELRLASSEI